MKYKVEVTIDGYIEVEASSVDEAREIAEYGYSISSVVVDCDSTGEITKGE